MAAQLRLLLGFIVAMTLTACGINQTVPTATLRPSATLTPIGTTLPNVPTEVPAGFNDDNPIQIVIVPSDLEAATPLVDALDEQLETLSGLTVEVVLAETQSEAQGAVCNSTPENVAAAWVSGMTYAAAIGQDCGIATLYIGRGTERDPDIGETGVFLMYVEPVEETDSEEEQPEPEADIQTLVEGTFCRTSVTDLFSWVVPTLVLRTNGLDIGDLGDVNEVEDYDTLVESLRTGECSAIGLPERVWEDYLDADRTLADNIVVVETTTEIPYGVMVFPFAAKLDAINALTEALLEIDVLYGAAEPDDPESEATEDPAATPAAPPQSATDLEGELAVFFGEGVFHQVNDETFAEFNAFLEASGLNLVQPEQ